MPVICCMNLQTVGSNPYTENDLKKNGTITNKKYEQNYSIFLLRLVKLNNIPFQLVLYENLAIIVFISKNHL